MMLEKKSSWDCSGKVTLKVKELEFPTCVTEFSTGAFSVSTGFWALANPENANSIIAVSTIKRVVKDLNIKPPKK